MTATNDLLVFAAGSSANVVSQSTYAGLAALTTGFQSGTALSNQLNKVWRQSSFAAATLGQLAADYSGNNTVDDGNVANFEANLVLAIKALAKAALPTNANGYLANNGSGTLSWQSISSDFLNGGNMAGAANAITATCVPTAKTTLDVGTILIGRLTTTNTSTSVTLQADASAAMQIKLADGSTNPPVGSLVSGHLLLFEWNGTNWLALFDYTSGFGVGSNANYVSKSGDTMTGPLILSGNPTNALGAATKQYVDAMIGVLVSEQYFTSSNTYTPSAGVTKFTVEVMGAGGSGGGETTANTAGSAPSGGGGAGGYVRKLFTVSSGTATVVVGTGGAAVATGQSGNAGGSSSFVYGGVTLLAGGGQGGSPNLTYATGGTGGAASGGDINITGNPGQGGSQSGFPNQSGNGGAAQYGGAGIGGYWSGAANIQLPTAGAFGSGGGGGNGPQNSGAGGNGLVIIREYR